MRDFCAGPKGGEIYYCCLQEQIRKVCTGMFLLKTIKFEGEGAKPQTQSKLDNLSFSCQSFLNKGNEYPNIPKILNA